MSMYEIKLVGTDNRMLDPINVRVCRLHQGSHKLSSVEQVSMTIQLRMSYSCHTVEPEFGKMHFSGSLHVLGTSNKREYGLTHTRRWRNICYCRTANVYVSIELSHVFPSPLKLPGRVPSEMVIITMKEQVQQMK